MAARLVKEMDENVVIQMRDDGGLVPKRLLRWKRQMGSRGRINKTCLAEYGGLGERKRKNDVQVSNLGY